MLILFYSFLYWKLQQINSPLLNDSKAVTKMLFTWNPTEILFNLNKKFDVLYTSNKNIRPVSNFWSLYSLINENIDEDVYFYRYNTIYYNSNWEVIANKGQLINNDGTATYTYNIYQKEKKASEYDSWPYKIWLRIYKEPYYYKINNDELNKNRIYNLNIIEVEKNIDYLKLDKKNLSIWTTYSLWYKLWNKDIYSFLFYDNWKKIWTVWFDDIGKIINIHWEEIKKILNK